MVVNYEFLGDEPIENLITCMNFKIDKAVFFGYNDSIEKQRKTTEKFLKMFCGVKSVVFHALSQNNLQSTLSTMRKEIEHERSQNNQIYFDITGGESLILVAFGMLSREFETPIHIYDIVNDKLIEMGENTKSNLSENVQVRKVTMTLDLLIRMHGGQINKNLRKDIKSINDDAFIKDVEKIFGIANKNWDYWNPFADFLRNIMVPVNPETLQVSKKIRTVEGELAKSKTKLKSIKKFNEIIDELARNKILLNVEHSNNNYRFKFKNEKIKECLWEGGSILELHTYQKEIKNGRECQLSVSIDWDGKINNPIGIDVLNEIDVLTLEGNIPTFISCKSGKMSGNQALHALYELETVTSRFGGKYAKKVLVSAKEIGEAYIERANEMEIEVRQI